MTNESDLDFILGEDEEGKNIYRDKYSTKQNELIAEKNNLEGNVRNSRILLEEANVAVSDAEANLRSKSEEKNTAFSNEVSATTLYETRYRGVAPEYTIHIESNAEAFNYLLTHGYERQPENSAKLRKIS